MLTFFFLFVFRSSQTVLLILWRWRSGKAKKKEESTIFPERTRKGCRKVSGDNKRTVLQRQLRRGNSPKAWKRAHMGLSERIDGTIFNKTEPFAPLLLPPQFQCRVCVCVCVRVHFLFFGIETVCELFL